MVNRVTQRPPQAFNRFCLASQVLSIDTGLDHSDTLIFPKRDHVCFGWDGHKLLPWLLPRVSERVGWALGRASGVLPRPSLAEKSSQ
jgi:hypothetical protein